MTVSRRHLLTGSAAAVAAGFAGAAQATDLCKAPAKWDETFDVIVIGAGGAGLTAAIVAKEAGAKTLLLEKMGFPGGNTIIAGGGFNAAIKEDYEKAGIKDSPELHAEQTLAAGDFRADPELVRILTEGAPESVAWLKKRGVKFQDYIYQIYGGIYPRCRNPLGPRGQAYIQVLAPEAKRVGVDLRTNAKVLGIHREHALEGRVTGVEVEIGGKKLNIRATKGVIACAGGFSANAKMCGIHDPRLEKLGTTNQPGATGEVLVAMQDIGALAIGLDYIQCIPGTAPGYKSKGNLIQVIEYSIFVNKEGKRFVAEDSRRDVIRDATLAQTAQTVYPLTDSVGFAADNKFQGETNKKALADGTLFEAQTIEELAGKIGVPAEELKKTIAEYNKTVDTKKDPLGRAPRMLAHKIEKAPFYAGPIGMARHHTMGGVKIDVKARVLDRHGKVIPGLYAAGEVTGSFHGRSYLGSTAFGKALIFGYIAAGTILKA